MWLFRLVLGSLLTWIFCFSWHCRCTVVDVVVVGKTAFNLDKSRECGAPYLFLNALLHPSIRWRSHHFRLHWGGKAEAVVEEVHNKKKEVNFLEVPVIKLVSKSGKMGEVTSSRSIS